MTEAELAWLAGLLEGEGCFTAVASKKPGHEWWAFGIALKMVDKDVVWKAAGIAGMGNLTGPSLRYGKQPQWIWRVQRRAQVVELCEALRPWMGERRAARIDELLELEKRAAKPKPAVHGSLHTYKRLKCRCDACKEAAARHARRWRETKAEKEGRVYQGRSTYGRGRKPSDQHGKPVR